MRFSAVQENGYGVGLPQDRLPNDADESMMAATGDIEPENDTSLEEGPMVSNLPLLFANGYPTSLEKITLAQLERFITFMVQCSLGHDTTEVISEPQWWPKEVKFSNPLVRPKKVTENWMANLKKLVFRCYTYHRSEYLLRFCSCLARYPHDELEYVNNWDSTTSLYHKSSGKLLVTFRNENMNYDKKDSPRKTLLSHNGVTSGNKSKQQQQQQHSLIMVEPLCDDIYLCDNCDAEFMGLEKMKEHERTCCDQEHGSGGSRPATPEILATEPELNQGQFLEYFQLSSKDIEPKSIRTNNGTAVSFNVPRPSSRRVRGSINFTRAPSIPFSSPAGIMLAKKSKAMTEDTQQERLERIERHVIAPVLNDATRPKWLDKDVERDRWVVTYKTNRDKADDYVHQYKFGNSYRAKPMLNIRSQLLCIVCRPIYVVLTRLGQEQMEELKRDPSKYRPPLRTILNRKIGPASKTKSKPHVSSKRKAPSDVDEEADDASTTVTTTITTPVVTSLPTTSSSISTIFCNISTTASTTSGMSAGALTAYETIKSPQDTTTNTNSIKENTVRYENTNAVMCIDLCSSDEEQDSSVPVSSDENRDPMDSTDVGIQKSLLHKLSPGTLCSKNCIYPTESSSDWISDNILPDDSESSTNKCRDSVVLNTCTHLSPILRPAP